MDSYKLIAPSIKMFDSYPDSYHKDAFDSYHKDSLNSYYRDSLDSYSNSYHKDSLDSYVCVRFQHMRITVRSVTTHPS